VNQSSPSSITTPKTFFNKLNQLIADFPPAKADSNINNKMGALGIGAGKKFNLADFDTTTQSILKTIPAFIHSELRVAAGSKCLLSELPGRRKW